MSIPYYGREIIMRQKKQIAVVIISLIFIMCMANIVYAGSRYADILISSELSKSVPYAVKYKIKETNNITESIKDSNEKGNISEKSAAAHVTEECLYVTDNLGNERFDYSIQAIPYDNSANMPDPVRVSLFKSPDEVIKRRRKPNGEYYSGETIFNEDYMHKYDYFSSQYIFPIFGLGVLSREEKKGFISLDDAVKTELGKEPSLETEIYETRIHLDREACTAEIKWGDHGLTQSINYIGDIGDWKKEIKVIEVDEKQGYTYPIIAKYIQKMEDDKVLNVVDIEVTELLIGQEALEKYPIEPPPLPEDAVITDERTNE